MDSCTTGMLIEYSALSRHMRTTSSYLFGMDLFGMERTRVAPPAVV